MIILTVCAVLLLSACGTAALPPPGTGSSPDTSHSQSGQQETVVLSDAGERFYSDCIIVTLKKETVGSGRTYGPEDFPGTGCTEVLELTKEWEENYRARVKAKQDDGQSFSSGPQPGMFDSLFHRILILYLQQVDASAVRSAVSAALQNEDVLYASPNYVDEETNLCEDLTTVTRTERSLRQTLETFFAFYDFTYHLTSLTAYTTPEAAGRDLDAHPYTVDDFDSTVVDSVISYDFLETGPVICIKLSSVSCYQELACIRISLLKRSDLPHIFFDPLVYPA
ncbi:MAG: hypothetical protein IJR83_06305 [Clostridia bacterium]|nr:hypothetical protein [Clostridia bacterium]